jgi:hypothetical protein
MAQERTSEMATRRILTAAEERRRKRLQRTGRRVREMERVRTRERVVGQNFPSLEVAGKSGNSRTMCSFSLSTPRPSNYHLSATWKGIEPSSSKAA